MTATTTEATGAAFFDVDETLVTCKTIFSFLEFYYRDRGLSPDDYQQACAMLADIVTHGGTRAESNRAYYRLFAGQCVTDVADAGQRWFASVLDEGLFHEPVRRELQRHRDSGHLTVLVSGSFHACLDPIAEHLGADIVLGTDPAIINGRYTGDITAVRIGDGKAIAVSQVRKAHGIPRYATYAYADHASDLELLTAVDQPVVVGSDPVLLERVRVESWHWIDGIERR